MALIGIGVSVGACLLTEEGSERASERITEHLVRVEETYSPFLEIGPGDYREHLREADALISQGNLEEARSFLEAALSAAETPDQRVYAHLRLGNLEDDLGRLNEALEHYQRAANASPDVLDRALAAAAIGSLANSEKDRGNWEAAEELYDRAWRIQSAVNDRLSLARTVYNMGCLAEARNDLDAALVHYQEAEVLYGKVGDMRGKGKAVLSQARIANVRSEVSERDRLLDEAEDLILGAGEPSSLVQLLAFRAQVERQEAAYDLAKQLAQQALEISRSHSLRYLESEILGLLGYISRSAGNLDESLAYHSTALELKEALGDEAGQAVAHLDIAFVHQVAGDATGAYASALEALKRAEESGFADVAAASNATLGAALVGLGRYQEGLAAQCRSWSWYSSEGYLQDAEIESHNILMLHRSPPEKLC